jgi:hypothetical protein
MRLTVPHYYDFGADRAVVGGDLLREEAWDGLRVQTDGPFGIPADRSTWERTADEHPELAERARAIAAVCKQRGARSLASYGVGGATLELWLHRAAPDLALTLTDYAPRTVERVASLFPEAKVTRHDLTTDPPPTADVHLFHRIDTELTNAQWRQAFRQFAGVPVILVAGDVVDLRRAVAEVAKKLRNRQATRCGWLRSREALASLWSSTHDATPLALADLEAWVLEPRR